MICVIYKFESFFYKNMQRLNDLLNSPNHTQNKKEVDLKAKNNNCGGNMDITEPVA